MVKNFIESKSCTLYSLANWQNGLAFKNITFSNSGLPIIKIAELKNGITDQTKFTQDKFDKNVFLTKGDMLFSWSGNPETSIDTFIYNLSDGWLNQHIFKITPKNIDSKYFYYVMKSLNPVFKRIASNKQTTGLGHVTVKDLKEIKIFIPSHEEQHHIVNILGTIDDKIENNEELINNYNSLMGYNVVAGMNNEYLPLKEMCSVITKGTTPTTLGKKFVTSGINFIKAESILENHIIDGYKLSFIDEETHNLLKRSQIQEYDILLSIAGTIGRFSFASKEYFPANTNQAVAIIRPKNLINFIHIYSYFCSNLQNIYFNEQTVQGVQANISLSTVSNTPIPQFTNDKILQENLIIFNKLLNAVNENKKLNKLKQLYLKKFFG